MDFLKFNRKLYHLVAVAFNVVDESTTCGSCYTSLAHALRTGKPQFRILAFYDYGIAHVAMPELSLAEGDSKVC